METEGTEPPEVELDEEAVPICLRCCRPVDPLAHYCPHCGEASGRFTTYLPFESIPWQMRIWGRAWHQIWSPGVSFWGRLFRLLMIIWQVPILLIGLLFRKPSKSNEEERGQPVGSTSEEENSISEESQH